MACLLTVIAPIRQGQADEVDRILTEIGRDVGSNPYIRLGDISSLHFLSCAILANDPAYPPALALESTFDGDVEAHLDELVASGRRALDALYGRCEGYLPEGARSAAAVKQYLRDHAVPSAIFYVALPEQTVGSIRNAVAVREEAERFLDAEQANGALRGLSAVQIYERLQRHLSEDSPVRPQVSVRTQDQLRVISRRNAALIALVVLPLAILFLPLLAVFMLALRWHEIREQACPAPPPPPSDPRLYLNDAVNIQHHLTTLVTIKPGRFRRWTLRAILWASNFLARTVLLNGDIAGIPTIHCVRWIVLDGGKRLLFFSHYDGSWQSYLGDFSDRASWTLTAIYSNTENFPPSRWLLWGGASDIQAFKSWTHRYNVYTPVSYSAYPQEAIGNLQKEIRFRDAVGRLLDTDQAERLLQLL